MRLKDAQALVDRCFAGVAEGASRLYEPDDPRFTDRPSAVWLEYRWYVLERGLAEVFLKWGRVSPERSAEAEASVVRVHLIGDSSGLSARAHGLLEGGRRAPSASSACLETMAWAASASRSEAPASLWSTG